MYSLTDICFLCLVHTKSLTSTLSEDDDGIVLEEKLKCFLIEYVQFKPEVIKYVCMTCFANVNNLYSFRQQCLRNMTTLNDYFDKLAIAPPYKHFLEVRPDNQTISEGMEIETKHELKCEELDIEESGAPTEDSIQHKPIEVNIVVKSEPLDSFEDEEFINNDTIENLELSDDNGADEDFVNESEPSTSKFLSGSSIPESEESLSDAYSSDDSETSTDSDENICNKTAKDVDNEQHTLSVKKACRKRERRTERWKKSEAKHLRNSGQSYKSISLITKDDGTKERIIVSREAKKLLPPCSGKCRLKCSTKLTEECRQTLFNEYWGMANLQKQRDFISNCIQTIKTRYEKTDNCRRLNNAFYFHLDGQNIRVCKEMFMSTLNINSRIIRTVIEKQESVTKGINKPEMRGKHANHATVPQFIKEGVRNHIKSIPRIKSHSQTTKEYIRREKSVAELYRNYKKSCEEQNIPYTNYLMYYNIFNNDFSIGFFNSKKDKCKSTYHTPMQAKRKKYNLKKI